MLSHTVLLLDRHLSVSRESPSITLPLLGDPDSSAGDQGYSVLCPFPSPVDGECEKSLTFLSGDSEPRLDPMDRKIGSLPLNSP